MKLLGWLFPDRSAGAIPVPEGDPAGQAIRDSTDRLDDAKCRREQVDELVDSLREHREANHFGERLDAIFVARSFNGENIR